MAVRNLRQEAVKIELRLVSQTLLCPIFVDFVALVKMRMVVSL